ncbi:hypothetical protein GS982_31840 [Rhodococcus hoagii]|nr:hypothetical protein [Prescottella equi]NKZ84534.1 hypothetical protein [Prescottella equi]NKZ86550.1 hypothetical protein [Prescottella equi]NKZ86557.1 hypothetical protein [Prescottella equi]
MPVFREVVTGQIVEDPDPLRFDGLARWERIAEELRAPAERVEVAAAAAESAQADLAAAQSAAADALDSMNDALAAAAVEVDAPARTATRAEWVKYAKARGKTDAELKGHKAATIAAWFLGDE